MVYLLYIAAGLAAGIFSGLFGVGGGIIIVPILVLGFGLSQHMAQGTSLAAFVLPAFWLAVYTYYKAGNVNWMLAVFLCIGMLVGGAVGARIAHVLPAEMLKKMFGLLVVLIGLKMVLGK